MDLAQKEQKKGEEKIYVEVDSDLKDLIPTYLSNVAKTIQTMRLAAKENNMDQCRFDAHNLKGSGASYGFHFISEIAREIELLAQKSEAGKIGNCLERLENWLALIEISYSS